MRISKQRDLSQGENLQRRVRQGIIFVGILIVLGVLFGPGKQKIPDNGAADAANNALIVFENIIKTVFEFLPEFLCTVGF